MPKLWKGGDNKIKVLWHYHNNKAKVHFGWEEGKFVHCLCGEIYPRKITEDWDEITCKNCLKCLHNIGMVKLGEDWSCRH